MNSSGFWWKVLLKSIVHALLLFVIFVLLVGFFSDVLDALPNAFIIVWALYGVAVLLTTVIYTRYSLYRRSLYDRGVGVVLDEGEIILKQGLEERVERLALSGFVFLIIFLLVSIFFSIEVENLSTPLLCGIFWFFLSYLQTASVLYIKGGALVEIVGIDLLLRRASDFEQGLPLAPPNPGFLGRVMRLVLPMRTFMKYRQSGTLLSFKTPMINIQSFEVEDKKVRVVTKNYDAGISDTANLLLSPFPVVSGKFFLFRGASVVSNKVYGMSIDELRNLLEGKRQESANSKRSSFQETT